MKEFIRKENYNPKSEIFRLKEKDKTGQEPKRGNMIRTSGWKETDQLSRKEMNFYFYERYK